MTIRTFSMSVLVLVFSLLAVSAYADTLGIALDPFAVLAGTQVTNAGAGPLGATVITGSLGVSPGTSCTGFFTCDLGPGLVLGGTTEINTGAAAAAQLGLTAAIGNLNALGSPILVGAGGLSGASLGPGTYNVTSTTFDMLTGSTLTLTSPGQYVFRMSSTLTLQPDVTVNVSALDATSSVYWLAPDPTTAVTLGINDDMEGNILTNGAITFDTGATVGCGRALSQNKLVSFAGQDPTSLEENLVGGGCTGSLANSNGLSSTVVTPEPGTFGLFGAGLGLLLMSSFRRRKLSALRAA
jgi:Ice-binding-like/PEP-CTERM motif